jgi:DNA-binding MarR family transcriptional regulator
MKVIEMRPRAGSRDHARAQLADAFLGAMGVIRRLRGRESHRPNELSSAQYHLLFTLAKEDRVSTGELAAAADLSPAATTQMIDTLAAKGLVERTRSKIDRRVVICAVTKAGTELLAERRADIEQRWIHALADFSVKEIETAVAVVASLRALFEELDRDSMASHDARVGRRA